MFEFRTLMTARRVTLVILSLLMGRDPYACVGFAVEAAYIYYFWVFRS